MKRVGVRAFLPLVSFSVVVLIDQYCKHRVIDEFRVGSSSPVIPGLMNITYARNPGAALGIFSEAGNSFFLASPLALAALAVLALIACLVWFLRPFDWKFAFPLSLVIGGALGNLIDRYRLGFVVDFFDFHWHHGYHFPAFNFADLAIGLGAVVFVFVVLAHRFHWGSSSVSNTS